MRRLQSLACLALVCLSFLSCVDDVYVDAPAEGTRKAGDVYISLDIYPSSRTANTRADEVYPTGGEPGDGLETGQTWENKVTSVALFLYAVDADEPTDVNSTDKDTLVTMLQFSASEVKEGNQYYDYIATTGAQKVDLEEGTYRVLAVANPQDLSWAKGRRLTLGDVRDHIEKTAWTETPDANDPTTEEGSWDGTAYSYFLMTSENDKKGSLVTITEENNTEETAAATFVEVERTAARVDYRVNPSTSYKADDDDPQNTLKIPDKNEEGEENAYAGAKVTITGAALVNDLKAGSYLLKRTKDEIGSETVTYLGDEELDTSTGLPTNYVIDPWTDEKTNGATTVKIDNEEQPVSELYVTYYPGYAEDNQQNPSFWANLMRVGNTITDDDKESWNILGYTMENTTYSEYTNKNYNTAAVFGATFTPAEGTVVNSFYGSDTYDYNVSYAPSSSSSHYTFTPGESTFFRWQNTLYATAEDMMAAAYPEVFTANDMFGETTFQDISTKEGLEAFIAKLSDNDPTGYKAYLQSFEDFPTVIDSLYWANYMENRIHYRWIIPNAPTYIERTMSIDTDTRALLYEASGGMVNTYEDSQCYYTWWIRHANDNSDLTNGVMEYAIVRNNIYKLSIDGVNTIGGDVPDEGLRITVYVKNWTMLTEETIYL